MKYISILFILTAAAAGGFCQEKMVISSTKGIYPLYFDRVYVINVNNSYSTVIEAPDGYTLIDIILGDSKLFSSERNRNRATIKKLAPDNASTNINLVVQAPDKTQKTITFEVTGEASPKISNVKFMLPTDKELDAQLEAMKARYNSQMNQRLSMQEATVTQDVQHKSAVDLITFRFGSYPKTTSKKKLGAYVFLNSIVNSAGKGYIYLSTNAKDPNCQVVRLLNVQGASIHKNVKLESATQSNGFTHYVYSTSPFPKTGKKTKLKFNIKVYQAPATITAKVI